MREIKLYKFDTYKKESVAKEKKKVYFCECLIKTNNYDRIKAKTIY